MDFNIGCSDHKQCRGSRYEIIPLLRGYEITKAAGTFEKAYVKESALSDTNLKDIIAQATKRSGKDHYLNVYEDLSPNKTQQVNLLLDTLRAEENDPDAQWSLVHISRHPDSHQKNSETLYLRVIVKRHGPSAEKEKKERKTENVQIDHKTSKKDIKAGELDSDRLPHFTSKGLLVDLQKDRATGKSSGTSKLDGPLYHEDNFIRHVNHDPHRQRQRLSPSGLPPPPPPPVYPTIPAAALRHSQLVPAVPMMTLAEQNASGQLQSVVAPPIAMRRRPHSPLRVTAPRNFPPQRQPLNLARPNRSLSPVRQVPVSPVSPAHRIHHMQDIYPDGPPRAPTPPPVMNATPRRPPVPFDTQPHHHHTPLRPLAPAGLSPPLDRYGPYDPRNDGRRPRMTPPIPRMPTSPLHDSGPNAPFARSRSPEFLDHWDSPPRRREDIARRSETYHSPHFSETSTETTFADDDTTDVTVPSVGDAARRQMHKPRDVDFTQHRRADSGLGRFEAESWSDRTPRGGFRSQSPRPPRGVHGHGDGSRSRTRHDRGGSSPMPHGGVWPPYPLGNQGLRSSPVSPHGTQMSDGNWNEPVSPNGQRYA